MVDIRLSALLFLALTSGCVAAPDEATSGAGNAIVGGTATSNVPAIGYLTQAFESKDGELLTTGAFCTASLIGPSVVLTAAHCVDGMKANGLSLASRDGNRYLGIAFGVGDPSEARLVVAKRSKVHPEYPPNGASNIGSYAPHDMAYLLLEAPVSGVTPVTVRRKKHVGSCDYVAIGYGISQKGYRASDNDGSATTGERLSLAVCADANYVDEGVIRVYAGKTGSICQGDSGGALRISSTREIVGVTSYNNGLCDSDERAYYAPVAKNLDFIDEALRGGDPDDADDLDDVDGADTPAEDEEGTEDGGVHDDADAP